MKQNLLTEGSLFKGIVKFSLPFLLSYFLQTLYGLADLFIAGQFNGAQTITAVSVGSQVMHMLTVIIVGLAMGSTVLIGQAVGAKKENEEAKIIGNTTLLFTILSLLLTLLLLLLTKPVIRLICTPQESIEQTRTYLLICFAGIPAITAYNIIASIFRGKGDSKSPLVFVAVACVLNIALDYFFMGYLKMQSGGAALATVIAQTVSVAISLVAIKKQGMGKNISRSDFYPDGKTIASLLKIGVPVAAQDGFIQVSFMVITVIANRRGVYVAAAVGIVEKIITFLFLIPSSMLSTISVIASQNLGAGKPERAKKTLFLGTGIAAGAGFLFAIIFQFISEPVLSLFTSDKSVVTLGTQYLRAYVLDCFVAGIHFSFSGYFCAAGKSIYSFIHNAISILTMRIPGAWFASIHWPDSLYPMGIATVLGSLLSALMCLAIFFVMNVKEKRISTNFTSPGH